MAEATVKAKTILKFSDNRTGEFPDFLFYSVSHFVYVLFLFVLTDFLACSPTPAYLSLAEKFLLDLQEPFGGSFIISGALVSRKKDDADITMDSFPAHTSQSQLKIGY